MPRLKPRPKSKLTPVSDSANSAYSSLASLVGDSPLEIGTDRWCWSNGIMTETIRENLSAFAWISHPNTKHVELFTPDPEVSEERYLGFKIALAPKDFRHYESRKALVARLSKYSNLLAKWLLVKVLERNKIYSVEANVRKMVKDYLGPKVEVRIEVVKWLAN